MISLRAADDGPMAAADDFKCRLFQWCDVFLIMIIIRRALIILIILVNLNGLIILIILIIRASLLHCRQGHRCCRNKWMSCFGVHCPRAPEYRITVPGSVPP